MPVWGHFGSIGGHLCPSGGLEAKHRGLFWESVVRFVFYSFARILRHIEALGCRIDRNLRRSESLGCRIVVKYDGFEPWGA